MKAFSKSFRFMKYCMTEILQVLGLQTGEGSPGPLVTFYFKKGNINRQTDKENNKNSDRSELQAYLESQHFRQKEESMYIS